MKTHFFKTLKHAIKHWYLFLIAGLAFIAAALWVLSDLEYSYVWCAFIFSLSFVVSGAIEVVFSIVNRNTVDNWGWKLVLGLITLAVGIALLNDPEISMVTLPLYVGFVILFRSMNAIGISLDLKKYGVKDWGTLLGIGIIGVLIGFVLLMNPIIAGLSVVIWASVGLLTMGVYNIYLSFKLRKLHQIPSNISKELRDKLHAIQDNINEELNKG
ncbi:HdeD family acid-resistance protein [Eudoraea chungangensis]|uniref:HdeD family acid-resistance protein n=1 Tax=Eudoraea chungangensis TaxID=1481905 RepID=UPI0023ECE98D|nr:DUF308 domain-containing protein [Eudoraea chungangensis]